MVLQEAMQGLEVRLLERTRIESYPEVRLLENRAGRGGIVRLPGLGVKSIPKSLTSCMRCIKMPHMRRVIRRCVVRRVQMHNMLSCRRRISLV